MADPFNCFTDNRKGAEYWGGCARISMELSAHGHASAEEAAVRARVATRYAMRLLEKRERRTK